jgi:ATP-binding cassette subfamily B protein
MFFLKYYFKNAPLYTMIYYLQTVVNSLIYVINSIYLLKLVFNAFEFQGAFTDIVFKILLIAVINIFVLLFNQWFNDIYSPKNELTVKQKIQKDIFAQTTKINLKYYDDNEFYDDYILSLRESGSLGRSILEVIGKCLYNLIAIGTITAILLSIDFFVVCFVLTSVLLGFIIDIIITKKQTKKDFNTLKYHRKIDYFKRIFYLQDHIEEIKSTKDNRFLFTEFQEASTELLKTNKKMSKPLVRLYAFKGIMESLLTSFSVYFVLIYKLAVTKSIAIGDFSASVNSIWRLSDQLTQIVGNITQLYRNTIYGEKIYTFLHMEADEDVRKQQKKHSFPKSPGTLTVKNLYFSYDETTEILKDINLSIIPKQKIAIVGQNGSGKSTLVKLLIGFYNANSGQILLNNIPLKEYDFSQLYSYYHCLFQDFQIYATTLEQNLYMDNVKNSDGERLMKVINQIGFHDKVKTMKHGLKTIILQEFDDEAVQLSGGERQKVALARVLLSDACIIVLDEPSSALDPSSERNFNDLLASAFNDRTVIFISHRFFSTQNADNIYLLSNGRITEKGTHEELIKMNGQYAYMYNLQKEKYSL